MYGRRTCSSGTRWRGWACNGPRSSSRLEQETRLSVPPLWDEAAAPRARGRFRSRIISGRAANTLAPPPLTRTGLRAERIVSRGSDRGREGLFGPGHDRTLFDPPAEFAKRQPAAEGRGV